MAKLTVAILFLFFTLSLGRTPVTQPVNDDVTHIQLPSANDVILPERPNTLPESSPTLTLSSNSKSDAEESHSVHPMPLTFVRFRPINRRFRLRSNIPFRLCRHNLKPDSRRQISYGNDMILSSGKNVDFDKLVYRVGLSHIPETRFNFHHHDDDDHKEKKMSKFLDDRYKFGKMKLINRFSDHRHHHDDHDEHDDHEKKMLKSQINDLEKFGKIKAKNENQFHGHHDDDDDKRSKLYGKSLRKRFHYRASDDGEEKAKEVKKWHKKENKKGGIMRNVRKFLDHYFD